jgi:hypothetical protein
MTEKPDATPAHSGGGHTHILARLVAAIDAALGQVPGDGPSSPWLGWLVVGLLGQRVRQSWHRGVVDRLPKDAAYDDGGDVPGLSAWKYHFHGIGCCLTGPDGEVLDVDRRDDDAAVIDAWFFATRVQSLCKTRFVEERLWRWLPNQGLIVAACADLCRSGVLVPCESDRLFRLSEPLERRASAVAAEDFNDSSTAARWSSALGQIENPLLVAAHHAWLLSMIVEGTHAYDALTGAAEIVSDEDLADACIRVVAGRIGPASGKAIEILRARRDRRACKTVRTLLDRLSPTDDLPYPAYEALAYLLEHSTDRGDLVPIFQRFATVEQAAGFRGNPFLGSYATLALLFLPTLAMDLVRRALRSHTPICVSEVAALLAGIDQPWCHRELASALASPAGPARAYVVEALRRCTGDVASARASTADLPPREPPGQIGFTYEQVLHRGVRTMFEPALAKTSSMAEDLRSRYPPDWTG